MFFKLLLLLIFFSLLKKAKNIIFLKFEVRRPSFIFTKLFQSSPPLISVIFSLLSSLSTSIFYEIDLNFFSILNLSSISMKKITSSQFLLFLSLLALWFTSIAFGADTTHPEEGIMSCMCISFLVH